MLVVPGLLDEIDDGAVIETVVDGEVNPVLVVVAGDDDLVAGLRAHDRGVPGVGLAVKDIALRGGILREVDLRLEVFELVVHTGLPFPASDLPVKP